MQINLLKSVKRLLLLPNTELMTTKMVVDYYEVAETTIRQLVVSYKEEIILDGYKYFTGEELSEFKSRIGISMRGSRFAVFTKRAVLRIGMLLRYSEVAKEVRTQLLNSKLSYSIA